MKLLPFPFSCVYSGVKLFVLAIKSRRRYSIVWFIYELEEKNSNAEVIFREVTHDVNKLHKNGKKSPTFYCKYK